MSSEEIDSIEELTIDCPASLQRPLHRHLGPLPWQMESARCQNPPDGMAHHFGCRLARPAGAHAPGRRQEGAPPSSNSIYPTRLLCYADHAIIYPATSQPVKVAAVVQPVAPRGSDEAKAIAEGVRRRAAARAQGGPKAGSVGPK